MLCISDQNTRISSNDFWVISMGLEKLYQYVKLQKVQMPCKEVNKMDTVNVNAYNLYLTLNIKATK